MNDKLTLEELDEKFLLFREELLKQIHQFEQDYNCHIITKNNLEFTCWSEYINLKK